MSEPTPSGEETPNTLLAQMIADSLKTADLGASITDQFTEDLAAGKISPEDWRRLAQKGTEEELAQQAEKQDG